MQVAALMGVTQARVSQIEHGKITEVDAIRGYVLLRPWRRRRSRLPWRHTTSGSPQDVPERDRTKTSWPSCSAATSEDPVVSRCDRISAPLPARPGRHARRPCSCSPADPVSLLGVGRGELLRIDGGLVLPGVFLRILATERLVPRNAGIQEYRNSVILQA